MSKGPNFGAMGGNMANIMREAQKMQQQVKEAQDEIKNTEYEGHAAGDLVTLKMNGERKVTDLKIADKLIDPDDPDTLQDMVIMAINDANDKMLEDQKSKMGQYASGLGGMDGLM
ncbi:YbaB/EbfC family nucleoid-associated protein [Companilactobacillus mishanensis]|uniref:Nucleoid-associated protein FHL02_07940 n=1 Tax=Companilactobacillus mishanensis TaxID=2486008 RepID=A0A5P0ZIP0_9LACO|nr:YbaB/EbfC family nucleoid-associated protein [Companilactobacillus mishanensis]MQS44829.1 YbaB/EbfC family nucleoid-associated protein [Companilactobacillus mishanensis]MQS52950.1 YbaB/EbfC family nucleoid-associated protein [Companilactobacillus mishanensis]MQS89345.1 YbaB/EbfC family nucleoid-associated protein [Companilactobacillus mishanensis]